MMAYLLRTTVEHLRGCQDATYLAEPELSQPCPERVPLGQTRHSPASR